MTAQGDGRVQWLGRVATDSGQFAILALDHVRSFATSVRPHDPDSLTPDLIRDAKQRLIEGLVVHASAVLLDPVTVMGRIEAGLQPLSVGLIVGIEDGDYDDAAVSPRLLPGWNVERAARLGADAVKISFYFDPAGDVGPAERLVKESVRQCAAVGLPLFCEPLVRIRGAADAGRTVLEGVRRFGSLGADVLKIQFPFNTESDPSRSAWADACAEADELSPSPWALLSEGRDYHEFRELLAIACRAGASGFLGGRAIWGGAISSPDAMATYARRLADLRAIAIAEGSPYSRKTPDAERPQRAAVLPDGQSDPASPQGH